MNQNGFLIAIEGIDGSGKTTLSEGLARDLNRRGLKTLCVSSRLIESNVQPSPLLDIRRIIKCKNASRLTEGALLSLYAASLSQRNAEYIIPALEKGTTVIADRLIDTLWVTYSTFIDPDVLKVYLRACTKGVIPNHTFICDIQPQIALQRKLSVDTSLEEVEKIRWTRAKSIADRLRSLCTNKNYTSFNMNALTKTEAVEAAIRVLENQGYI